MESDAQSNMSGFNVSEQDNAQVDQYYSEDMHKVSNQGCNNAEETMKECESSKEEKNEVAGNLTSEPMKQGENIQIPTGFRGFRNIEKPPENNRPTATNSLFLAMVKERDIDPEAENIENTFLEKLIRCYNFPMPQEESAK
ncbi:hypothetical protein ACJJTC_005629 [Scirpophaga incertulas]